MSTLHYRSSFDLTAENPERSCETLLKVVRQWIAKRPDPDKEDDFWSAWFFQGGQWKSQAHPGVRVRTQSCYGDCSRQNPNCWAGEYEHLCDEFPSCRFWRVRIGIEQFNPNQFHLNCQTLYDIRPGYLGPEPAAPFPSPPGLITTLLRSSYWRCMAGPEKLSTSPRVLRIGEGHLFKELVASSERTCPIVLVSQIYCDQGCAIDSTNLARLLAGTAIVFQSESSEVDTELEYVLGKQYSCWNGMVRIYVPGLSFDRQGDEKRHRFILKREIDSSNPDAVTENIVRCIARRSTRPKGVLTPLDVEAVDRRRRVVHLRVRAKQSSASKDEYMQLLDVLEEENNSLRKDKSQLEADKQLLEDHNDSLQDNVRRLGHDKGALQAGLAQRDCGGGPVPIRDCSGEPQGTPNDAFRGC